LRGEGVEHCYAKISVVDAASGEGVGCVQVTVGAGGAPVMSGPRLVTDADGVIAFFEPGWMGKAHRFRFERDGYDTINTHTLTVGENTEVPVALTANGTPPSPCNVGTAAGELVLHGVPQADEYASIRVVDAETGRGVPLVLIRISEESPQQTYVTDSNGFVAFYDPILMDSGPPLSGTCVGLGFESYGYEPEDPSPAPHPNCTATPDEPYFLTPGASIVIEASRVAIAERLYRMTGAGIYRDSWLLGVPQCDDPGAGEPCIPLEKPLNNALVFGQDATHTAKYGGKLFWRWGDTEFPDYAQMRPHGGLSDLPTGTSCDAAQGAGNSCWGFDVDYFKSGGRATKITPPPPPIARWNWNPLNDYKVHGLFTIGDAPDESLFAYFVEKSYEGPAGTRKKALGISKFNEASGKFLEASDFCEGHRPEGEDYCWLVPRTGGLRGLGEPEKIWHHDGEYVYFSNDGGTLRVRATEEAILVPEEYESFTPFTAEGVLNREDENSPLQYTWVPNAKALTQDSLEVIEEPSERLLGDIGDPDPTIVPEFFYPHPIVGFWGVLEPKWYSIRWNPYRKRFIGILDDTKEDFNGRLGTVWYLEGDTPMGPWAYGRIVANQSPTSFLGAPHPSPVGSAPPYGTSLYQPRHHSVLDPPDGTSIYFDGTYSTQFTVTASNAIPAPYYNYNTIMYRLDLRDERLRLPVPIYDLASVGRPGDFVDKLGLRHEPERTDAPAAFFAQDRPTEDSIPVYWTGPACASRALVASDSPTTKPVFYAYAGELYGDDLASSLMLPLYEFVENATGDRAYSVEESLAGYTRVDPHIALVWPNRMHGVTLPVSDYLPPLIVDAGDDQCPVETSPEHGATVNLYASVSDGHSGAGGPGDKVYSWYTWPREDGDPPFATGQEVERLFSTGVHSVILEVVDSAGNTGSDSLVIEVFPDADSDSVPDAVDNCVNVVNASQCDTNSDGYGNVCDADLDNDGVVGAADFGLFATSYGQSVPPGDPDADLNCSGYVDGADFGLLGQGYGGPPGPSGLACAGTTPCP
jgi:hypothetical protein